MSTHTPFQFGLSSLLLIMTLVAVILSVSVMVPGIGIALAMASVPALLRTYVLVRRRREAGMPATNQEKAVLFLLCLGIAVLIAIATGAAFFASCFAGFFAVSTASGGGESSLITGFIVGGIAGTCVALPLLIYMLRKWFKHPPSKPKPTTGEHLHAWREQSDKPPDEEPRSIEPVPRETRAVQSPEPTTKPPGEATP